MFFHNDIGDQELLRRLRRGKIQFAGNKRLKIFGLLRCKSGKTMKRDNRVFFDSREDALINGYRPCGHCMRKEYLNWKHETI